MLTYAFIMNIQKLTCLSEFYFYVFTKKSMALIKRDRSEKD